MSTFQFKNFTIHQDRCAMKVGIDAVTLGAWCPLPENCERILDIGSGTGILSLLLAERSQAKEILGVEIDAAAAEQSRENFAASPYGDRLKMISQPIQEYLKTKPGKFDLIVSNPPFFSGGVLSEQLSRQTARHTVRMSHQDLLRAGQKLLSDQGLFCVVLPKIEGLRFIEMAATLKFTTHYRLDLKPRAGKPVNRLFIALGKKAVRETVIEKMTQYAEGQEWTAAFAALVGPFYRAK